MCVIISVICQEILLHTFPLYKLCKCVLQIPVILLLQLQLYLEEKEYINYSLFERDRDSWSLIGQLGF